MIRSFFAMIWNPDDPDAERAAQHILRSLISSSSGGRPRFESKGLMVLSLSGSANGEITPFPEGALEARGAIFGLMFRSSELSGSSGSTVTLSHEEVDFVEKSSGAMLLQSFWGSYVAFIPSREGWLVLPEPAASIPCYYTSRDGVTLVFSHLEICDFLDRTTFSVNFSFLSRLLIYDRALSGETALNEVREVLPGQMLVVSRLGTRCAQAWDPRPVAADRLELPPSQAALLLAETTRYVVSTWQSAFDRIAVSLSGGLDSSIVLACLEPKGHGEVIAIHQKLGADDLSEAAYAAEAAKVAGCRFVEVVVPFSWALPDPGSHPLSVRPLRQFVNQGLAALFGTLEAPYPDAIFTGQGGDHLFFHNRSPYGFFDFIRNRGLDSGLFRELINAARLSGLSVWDVVWAHFTSAPAEGAMLTAIRRKMPEDIATLFAASDWLPEWANERAGLPAGKFEQLTRLVHLFQLREPLIRSAVTDIVHPLISQPLIELCLRIPVYTLSAGGISRGLARQAFKGAIPDSIRYRMVKGQASSYFSELISANRNCLIEALNGGALSNAELVDPGMMRRLLSTDGHRIGPHGTRLLSIYAAEAWLRSWQTEIRPQGRSPR